MSCLSLQQMHLLVRFGFLLWFSMALSDLIISFGIRGFYLHCSYSSLANIWVDLGILTWYNAQRKEHSIFLPWFYGAKNSLSFWRVTLFLVPSAALDGYSVCFHKAAQITQAHPRLETNYFCYNLEASSIARIWKRQSFSLMRKHMG